MDRDSERELEKSFEDMLRAESGEEGTPEETEEATEAATSTPAEAPLSFPGPSDALDRFIALANARQLPSSSPIVRLPPGTSPEEMLQWLRNVFNVMQTCLPPLISSQYSPSTLPTYAPVRETKGDIWNGVKDLLDFSSHAFALMDTLFNNAVKTGKGLARAPSAPEVPSAPSTSEPAETPVLQPHKKFLGSLMDFTSSVTSAPSGPASNLAVGELYRAFVKDETFLRSSLHQLALFLQSLPESDPNYIRLQSMFGLIVLHLYEVTWQGEHLDLGVLATTFAWLTVEDPREIMHMWPLLSRNWCYGQRLLAQKTGEGEKLSLCITLLDMIHNATKDLEVIPSRAKTFLHTELSCCLYQRYLLLEDPMNLDAAVQHFQTLCEGDDIPRNMYCYLGHACLRRFLESGTLDDLDRALYHATNASQMIDDRDPISFDTADSLHLLALCMEQRFYLQLDFLYLDQAIEKCRAAIQLLDENHPLFIRCKSDLALFLLLRFQSTDDAADLEASREEILTAIAVDKQERNTQVPLLVIWGLIQTLSADGEADLDEGIHLLSKARKDFSGPSYIESKIEEYLSRAVLQRYHASKSFDDLDVAIKHARLALNKTRDTAPRYAELAVDLGRLLMIMYSLSSHANHCSEAISLFSWAAKDSSGRPTVRFQAAREWANTAEECQSETLIDALECGLKLLPALAWAGNRMPIQYRILTSQATTLASRAAAYAIDKGQLHKAISYLEMGRNVLWSQALQFRVGTKTPQNLLEMNENQYLARFIIHEILDDALEFDQEQLSDTIEKLPPELIHTIQSLQEAHKTAMQAAARLGCEARVKRDIEQLGIFKQDVLNVFKEASLHNAATRCKTLQQSLQSLGETLSPSDLPHFIEDEHFIALLRQGPVVIINAHGVHCDAIVLSSTSNDHKVMFRHVPLPDMSGDLAQAWAETLREGIYRYEAGESTRQEYEEDSLIPVLQGLWHDMVLPIISSLRMHDDMKERIWWYPTGALAFLPIHAAGPYENDEPGLLELLPSSYIATLQSLIRACKAATEPINLLAIGQSETPGLTPLPDVDGEINSIRKHFDDVSGQLTILSNADATVYKVSKALLEHTWLHYAGHAHQDEEYPFHSAFYLHNGSLKLSRLMRLDLTRVQFAFLSACLTSAGDTSLPDECIHLAAGMQFSGVRSVIATMWNVKDDVSVRATARVYRYILHRTSGEPNPSHAAKALQQALLGMKKTKVPLMYRVPFIHTGI